MSRLRPLFSFVALIALATAFAACGSGGNSADESPQAVIDEATLQGIDSGNLDLSLDVKAAGKEGGSLDASLSGPFQGGGEGELPQLDLTAKASGNINGGDVDFDGGLVLLPNSAYVNYEGTEYEVDPTTFSFVESAIKRAQQRGGQDEATGPTACQEEAGKLEIASFVDNLENEGAADVGGTDTTKVSGDLDVPEALDSLIELAESPACRAQARAAGGLPPSGEIEAAKGEIESALKSAHIDVYVGDDGIVRKIAARLAIEPKNGGSGPKSVVVDLDLTLTGVNEEQEISAPGSAKPLNDLFLKLGINPIELLGLLQGEGGAGSLGDLLESFGDAAGGGSSGGDSGGQQAYLKCLQRARTPVDLQSCSSLLG